MDGEPLVDIYAVWQRDGFMEVSGPKCCLSLPVKFVAAGADSVGSPWAEGVGLIRCER